MANGNFLRCGIGAGCCAAMLALVTGHATAASFDCAKAATAVERLICSNDALGRDDEQLAEAYGEARESLPQSHRSALLREQRQWLTVRDQCLSVSKPSSCLSQRMAERQQSLQAQTKAAQTAFDRIIAALPDDPAVAARALDDYANPLADSWRVYLARFAPASGIDVRQAGQARESARRALAEVDGVSASLLDDLYASERGERADLTLLRMWLERSDYGDAGRPYVHCFVFRQQPAWAYDAMGPLFGSSRDGRAPVCEPPPGGLFDPSAWERLQAIFEPIVSITHSPDQGTIRFADFAQWRIDDLRLAMTPRDYLDLKRAGYYPESAESRIEGWADETGWSPSQRTQALQALAQVRAAGVAWLQSQPGLDPAQAKQVIDAYLRIWVGSRIGTPDG